MILPIEHLNLLGNRSIIVTIEKWAHLINLPLQNQNFDSGRWLWIVFLRIVLL